MSNLFLRGLIGFPSQTKGGGTTHTFRLRFFSLVWAKSPACLSVRACMAGMCVYRRSIPLPLIILMFPRAEHPGVFPSERISAKQRDLDSPQCSQILSLLDRRDHISLYVTETYCVWKLYAAVETDVWLNPALFFSCWHLAFSSDVRLQNGTVGFAGIWSEMLVFYWITAQH